MLCDDCLPHRDTLLASLGLLKEEARKKERKETGERQKVGTENKIRIYLGKKIHMVMTYIFNFQTFNWRKISNLKVTSIWVVQRYVYTLDPLPRFIYCYLSIFLTFYHFSFLHILSLFYIYVYLHIKILCIYIHTYIYKQSTQNHLRISYIHHRLLLLNMSVVYFLKTGISLYITTAQLLTLVNLT